MMRDCASADVERPELEDVAEEEDVFAAEGGKSAPEPGSCQVGVFVGCLLLCNTVSQHSQNSHSLCISRLLGYSKNSLLQ